MAERTTEILAFTAPEVAERLRVSSATVHAMIRAGTLRAVRTVPGGMYLIPVDALAEFLAGAA